MGVVIWICINFLPQFILAAVSIILASGGLKNAWKVITKFPAMIIIPMFTFWTFGPVMSNFSCKGINYKTEADRIKISFWLTWINILLTVCGAMIFSRISVGGKSSMDNNISIFVPVWIGMLIDFLYVVFIPLAIMIVIFIQFVDKCNFSCCCNYCLSNCFPVKKLTYLDVNNMDDKRTEEDIEMSHFN